MDIAPYHNNGIVIFFKALGDGYCSWSSYLGSKFFLLIYFHDEYCSWLYNLVTQSIIKFAIPTHTSLILNKQSKEYLESSSTQRCIHHDLQIRILLNKSDEAKFVTITMHFDTKVTGP